MEVRKMKGVKRYIPSREDFTEPLDMEKLKKKKKGREFLKLLGGKKWLKSTSQK
jgi:hypothetical protein